MRRPRARTTAILARYMAGECVKQIAHDHGTTTSNIYQLAGDHGAKMLRPKTPRSGQVPIIIALREQGFSYREIAERTEISRAGICLALKRWRPDLLARAKA